MIDAWPILRSQEMSNYSFFIKWGKDFKEIRVSWCLYRDYYKAYEVCYAHDKTSSLFDFDRGFTAQSGCVHRRLNIYARWNGDYQI